MKNSLKRIKEEILRCKKCSLGKTRINSVPGEGNSKAEIIFIGEAPGANEDRTGRPFCGRAGEILDELLLKAGIKREDIYITSILKCRPPGNRNPKEEEIRSCSPHLNRQIETIKPKIICCLGNFATAYIMKKFSLENRIQGISKIHGQVFFNTTDSTRIKIIPLYHPAVIAYNINMKPMLEKDFKMLKSV
jgi:DNA polymerase